MKTIHHRIAFALAVALLLGTSTFLAMGADEAAAPGPAVLMTQNFENGLDEWTKTDNAEILQAPEGGSYGAMRMETKVGISRFSSPEIELKDAKEVTVSFRYRSSVVPSGRLHVGSWVAVIFRSKDNQDLGDAAVACVIAEESSSWKEMTQTVSCPTGAAYLSLQPRLQQTDGKFDIDDLVVYAGALPSAARPAPSQPEAAAPATTGSPYKTLGTFTLSRDAGNAVLTGSGRTLANENPAGGVTGPFVFTLPDEFCENRELVYEITATVTPAWSTRSEKEPHGVFALGANILGQDPNSLTLLFWGDGSNLIARMLPSILGARAEVRQPVLVDAGAERTLRMVATATDLSAWIDGEQIGNSTSPREFSWPKGRPFVVGGERVNSAPFHGEINAFTLSVLEPVIRASFAGGADFGYFIGAGPHTFELTLANGIGEKAESSITVKDIDRAIVATLNPSSKGAGNHSYTLANLPYGWYLIETTVSLESAQLRFDRSLCIIPAAPERAPAKASIFGVTQEYPLYPDTVNPAMLDTAFGRMAAMGIRWFRAWIRWDYVERTQGTYDWSGIDQLTAIAAKHGIEIYACMHNGTEDFMIGTRAERPKPTPYAGDMFLPVIDPAAWRKFLTAFAERYQGEITYYQIWNETDTRLYWYPFKTDTYVTFMKEGGAALKAGNPDAVIALGGFCAALEDAFFEKMTHADNDAAYGLKEFYQCKPQPYYEIFDYHFYCPAEAKQRWDNRSVLVKRLKQIMAEQGEGDKPIWNGETGFTAATNPARVGKIGFFNVPLLSEKDHAARIVQWHLQSMALGIAVNINYLFNNGTFGPVYDDFSPRPAYAAHAYLAQKIAGKVFDHEIAINPDVRTYCFKGTDGYFTALWTVNGSEVLSVALQQEAIFRSDMFGNRTAFDGFVRLGEDPIYIESKEPPVIAPLVSMKVPDPVIAGMEFDLAVALNNPASSPSAVKIGVAFAGTTATRDITVPAGGATTETIRLPGTAGRLIVEGAFSGGVTQEFGFEQKVLPRPSLLLDGGREAAFEVREEKQVVAGGKVVDAQARTVSESKWNGADDLSAHGSMRNVDGTIECTIDVRDDQFFPANTALYNGDAIEVFVDARNDEERTLRAKEHVFQVVVAANGKTWASANGTPPGFTATVERTDGGWRAQVKFTAPEAARFGFDVSLDDDDDGGGRKVQMAWAGTDENHKSPDGYGVVVLHP